MPCDHLCLYRPPASRCEITFEHGDITEPGDKADLLIISAFADDYSPVPSSVIGRLNDRGLSVRSDVRPLAEQAGSKHCWISQKLCEPTAARIGADRILCYERAPMHRGGGVLGELQTLFSALLTRAPHAGQPPWSIRMPLVGTGNQGGDPEITLKLIVRGLQEAFANGLNVRAVRIIERDPVKFGRLQGLFRALRDSYSPFTAELEPVLRYKLFISYSHEDRELVRAAYEEIRPRIGTDVFVDYDGGVNEGMVLSRDLALAVRQSCAMIAVISPSYVASPGCRVEFATAYTRYYLRKDFFLKPIFLADPASFRYLPFEYRDVMGEGWEGPELLARRILEFVSRETGTTGDSPQRP